LSTEHLALQLRRTVAAFPERPAMRAVMDGDWKHFTYAEVGRRVNMMAAALIRAGIKRGDKVAIFSQNRPEWAWADYAALTIGAIVVPLYATSTPSQVRQIMADAGVQFAFVGGPSEAERVDEVWDEIPTLTDAAAFEPTDSPRYPTYGDLEIEPTDEEQAEIEARLAEARADDVATIIYTSGTTAEPKGVVLPHSNFFHQMDAVQDRYQLDETDRSLCFLPLSHVFERAWSYYVMALGAENVYVLDPKAVASILPLVKPTMFVSVPRLYEKVVATAKEQAESGLKKSCSTGLSQSATRPTRNLCQAPPAGDSAHQAPSRQAPCPEQTAARNRRSEASYGCWWCPATQGSRGVLVLLRRPREPGVRPH
jgi:long-chain acyl-CoA synthetase